MIQFVIGVAGLSLALGLYLGTAIQRHFQQRAAVKAAVELQVKMEAEREATAKLVAKHLADARKQQERANAIQTQLRKAAKELASCRVSPRVVRLLNDAAVPQPAAAPSGAVTAPAPAESDCAVVVESAAKNYSEVCLPNAQQLESLQRWYNDLRKR